MVLRILALSLLISCATYDSRQQEDPVSVSLRDLAGNLDKYHGHKIVTEGYYRWNIEQSSICPSDSLLSTGCFWVEFDDISIETIGKQIDSLDEQVVVVHATVDSSLHGHLGAYTATLKNVTQFTAKR